MRFAPLAALLVLVCTAHNYAEKPTTAPADTASDNRPMQATLQRKMPELRFDNVGFSDVIDFLRDVTGRSFFVNWKTIEAAGVDRNAPVTARLRDIPLDKALTIILDSISPKDKAIGWVVGDGVITISTKEDLQTNVITRTYDIRVLEPWRKNAAPATQPTDAKDPLIGMITGTIAPASWGKTSYISEVGGHLVVVSTEENHKLIANLLENLNRLAK